VDGGHRGMLLDVFHVENVDGMVWLPGETFQVKNIPDCNEETLVVELEVIQHRLMRIHENVGIRMRDDLLPGEDWLGGSECLHGENILMHTNR